MSRYIVLMDADLAKCASVAVDEEGDNLVFKTADEADQWVQDNARVGWCTLIVEVEQ
jgi:hypothetical protein